MRESNFNFPAQNRACVCISQALYDRRAIDAPSPSLPLLNSLTHLSYLTATSPRIREILSQDGGLERLVRILKNCSAPNAGQEGKRETLGEMKGKGASMEKGKRRSPFRPFGEYQPTLEDVEQLIDGVLVTLPRPMPPPQAAGQTQTSKSLLFTYSLAFQCVVNIGVRGSETIRTRVVEAGALDVVVNVLERYLEECERRKKALGDSSSSSASTSTTAVTVRRSDAPPPQSIATNDDRPTLTQLDTTNTSFAAASTSASPSPIAPSSHAHLAPPARVSTPDTIPSSSMDVETDADVDVDGDNGSSSGQEQDGEEEAVVVLLSLSQAQVEQERSEERSRSESKRRDADGDVVMGGDEESAGAGQQDEEMDSTTALSTTPLVAPSALPSTSTPIAPTPNRQRSLSRRHPSSSHHHHHPQPAPPPPPPSYSDAPPPATPPPAAPEGIQFRDEDVLLSLQLLAYLSKYPHVRSVFHSPAAEAARVAAAAAKSSSFSSHPHCADSKTSEEPTLSTNVFSLVEAFTHRPSSSDLSSPRHSSEVQYWAGVIMRNACRKDESRGGIRQCANMACGAWEKYAREFAKCRRCRKAKYCSKGCQSAAWGGGHRYWCAKAAPKEVGAGAAAGEEGARRRGAEGEEDDEEEAPPPPPSRAGAIDPLGHPSILLAHAQQQHGQQDPSRLRGLTPHRHGHQHPPNSGTVTPTNIPPPPPRLGVGFGLPQALGGEMDGGMGMMDENEVAREMMDRGGGIGGEVVFGLGGAAGLAGGGVAVVGEEM